MRIYLEQLEQYLIERIWRGASLYGHIPSTVIKELKKTVKVKGIAEPYLMDIYSRLLEYRARQYDTKMNLQILRNIIKTKFKNGHGAFLLVLNCLKEAGLIRVIGRRSFEIIYPLP